MGVGEGVCWHMIVLHMRLLPMYVCMCVCVCISACVYVCVCVYMRQQMSVDECTSCALNPNPYP